MFLVSIKFIYEFNLGSNPSEIKKRTYITTLLIGNLNSLAVNPRNKIKVHKKPIVYLGIGPKNIKYVAETSK